MVVFSFFIRNFAPLNIYVQNKTKRKNIYYEIIHIGNGCKHLLDPPHLQPKPRVKKRALTC